MVSRPRSKEPARPYKELIASPVYFSNEKWQECLASHGLVVDTESTDADRAVGKGGQPIWSMT